MPRPPEVPGFCGPGGAGVEATLHEIAQSFEEKHTLYLQHLQQMEQRILERMEDILSRNGERATRFDDNGGLLLTDSLVHANQSKEVAAERPDPSTVAVSRMGSVLENVEENEKPWQGETVAAKEMRKTSNEKPTRRKSSAKSGNVWQLVSKKGGPTAEEEEEEDDDFLTDTEKEEKELQNLPKWKQLIRGQSFDLAAGGMICANAVMIALELEWNGQKACSDIGVCSENSGNWPYAVEGFKFGEHFFCLTFFGELCLRLAASGPRKYFGQASNWLDFVIVVFSLLEMYVLGTIGVDMPKVTFIRLLRLVKLTKVLRIVRVMKVFHQLRVLTISIAASIGCLAWSVVFLTLVQMIASILMTQLLQEFIIDDNNDTDMRQHAFKYFGRFSDSMLTTLEITLAPGAWSKIGRPLIYQVSWTYSLFFIPYLWGVAFAIVRVISAIFLKQTLGVAASDPDTAMREKSIAREREVKHLERLFRRADKDRGGTVNREEFEKLLLDPRMTSMLSIFELEATEVSHFFQLLDDGDGEVLLEEFIAGILRMRGHARSLDLVTLMCENKRIHKLMIDLRHDVKHGRTSLGPAIS